MKINYTKNNNTTAQKSPSGDLGVQLRQKSPLGDLGVR